MKKPILFSLIIFIIFVVIKMVLYEYGITSLDTVLDMLLGGLLSLFISFAINHENIKNEITLRKTDSAPFFQLINPNKFKNPIGEEVCKITLKVPNTPLKDEESRENLIESCNVEIILKNYSHSDFIIDSFAFIRDSGFKNIKIRAYRICKSEYESFVERGKYYKLEIDMHRGRTISLNNVLCGIVVIDITPERNKYFFPIDSDFRRFVIGEMRELDNISDTYLGKMPDDIYEFFTKAEWIS